MRRPRHAPFRWVGRQVGEEGKVPMQSDPARRRQAAASALWIPVGYGIGSFSLAGARTGHQRVIDRAASVRGFMLAGALTLGVAAIRWRFGESRADVQLRRLFSRQLPPREAAAHVAIRALAYGALSVAGAALGVGLGASIPPRRSRPIPGLAPWRLPIAVGEASLLMGGALVAVVGLTAAVRREVSAQPHLPRARAIQIPGEPAIVAPGTAEEAFGDHGDAGF